MPVRARDLVRAAGVFGVEFREPHSGSHWQARLAGRVFPLPLHNGLKSEVSDRYVTAMCRALTLDEDELRKHL